MGTSLAVKLQFASIRYLSWVSPKVAAKWALDKFLTPQHFPRPATEELWLESARKFTLPGGIAAYEWGSPNDPLVVLVHGWSGRGTQMAAFADPLVKSGFRVVALDGPAHGDSEGTQTNAGDYARFLIQVQNELGPFKATIGHSFGAGCSVLAASWGMQTEKLIVIASPARYEVVVRNYLNFVKLSPRAGDYLFKFLEKKAGIHAKDISIGNLGKELKVQGLIVHDRGDKEVRFASAEEIKQAWSNAELLETKGLGHRRILKDSSVISAVVDFIAK